MQRTVHGETNVTCCRSDLSVAPEGVLCCAQLGELEAPSQHVLLAAAVFLCPTPVTSCY